jgi:hypothetical protein
MKLNKSFCGVQGRFFQKKPLAAGGNKSNFMAGENLALLRSAGIRFLFNALRAFNSLT